MDKPRIALLTVSHVIDDLGQGSLPVMLPFFMVEHDLSYSTAAGLVLAVTTTSSLLQPLLGQFADRHSAPWLVPVGLLFAGGGIALASLMPTYLLIVLAIGLSGVGIGAFHPEASRFANRAAGRQQATGMSIFSVGGNLGFALGPLLTTQLMLTFGLRGGVLLAVPTMVMATILVRRLPLAAPRHQTSGGKASAFRAPRGTDAWGPFSRLAVVAFIRAVIFYGTNTFLPLYWRDVLNEPVAAGGLALTLLLTSGAAGNLLGGVLGDRYGRRLVVLVGLAATGPLLYALLAVRDPIVATALLVPLGLALYAPMGVMIAMGQEYLPNRIGTASGVTMGLAVGVGGLAAPILGQVADSSGIPAALALLTFLPVPAFLFAATLPGKLPRRKTGTGPTEGSGVEATSS